MKRFNFRLERLLTLKKRAEDARQLALAKARANADLRRSALIELDAQRQELYTTERAHLSGATLDVATLKHFSRRQLFIRREELGGRATLAALDKEVERKREELIRATVERKALDTLKERRRETYVREELLSEQKETDEIAANTRRVHIPQF